MYSHGVRLPLASIRNTDGVKATYQRNAIAWWML